MAGQLVHVIDLHERESRVFPRGALFDTSGRSLMLPETRDLGALELTELKDGVELRALGLIGYLPLTQNLVLNIRPKFPVNNFWQMLAIGDERFDRILPVLRSYEHEEKTAPHLLLARGFCHYLKNILSIGVARGYYSKPYRGFFKPKVNFGQTVGRYLSRGDDFTVSANVFSFSAELQVNSVLKSACFDFLRLLPKDKNWLEERQLVLEALNALDAAGRKAMQVGDQKLAEAVPKWLRRDYWGALTAYSVLLGHAQVGFSYGAQGVELPSFLFRLDDIFENFIRNTLRSGLMKDQVSVIDGNVESRHRRLFADNKRFPVKPDAILSRSKQIVALAEIKYKPKVSETDRYQLISHAIALGSNIGVWISPSNVANESGLAYVGRMANGANFYHYTFNISADLMQSSANMLADIKGLILPG